MTGKLLVILILASAILFGGGLYYTQVYAFYAEIEPNGKTDVVLTNLVNGNEEAIPYGGFQAIDADSSPIRYRACFTTPLSHAMLTETYEAYENAVPRVAPKWFECFQAGEIGAGIEDGSTLVFTAKRNIEFGIDRVVAITDDGHGYIWHEVNECGDKAYDGTPLGDDCPARN